jgi:endonuclease/exonuclease/phosphatase family metal-dependent hydrolase
MALIVPVGILMTEVPRSETQALGEPFVLSYNLNHGFSAEGELVLESMARVIESAEPDIVALQEVPRGWLATGGVDVVAWLQHRLGIPIMFAASSDPQWGVALATPLPVGEPGSFDIGTIGPGQSPRSVLDVPVTIWPQLEIRIIVVQLHQIREDESERQAQLNDLVIAWGGLGSTLIVGDFGASPSDPIVRGLFVSGLVEVGRRSESQPYTWPSFSPVSQPDQIWYTPDLATSVARVVPLEASDHLALLARIGPAPVFDETDG